MATTFSKTSSRTVTTTSYSSEGTLQTLSEARVTRSSENKELSVLNDRFASYIEKVCGLQDLNSKLKAQVKVQEAQESSRSNICQLYETELKELRALVDQLTQEKVQLQAEKNSWQTQAGEWQGKCKTETVATEDVKTELTTLKADVDEATVARVGFENKLTTAHEEIQFLKALYDEETQKLQGHVSQAIALVESEHPVVAAPDFSQTLREIRKQYEVLGRANREEAEAKYKQMFSELAQQRVRDNNALVSARAELTDLKRQLQSTVAETEALKNRSGALESNIAETEARMQREIEDYKIAIRELEIQVEKMKHGMAQNMTEYQQLVNLKMALDVEISAYKKLLEGEETRLVRELKLTK